MATSANDHLVRIFQVYIETKVNLSSSKYLIQNFSNTFVQINSYFLRLRTARIKGSTDTYRSATEKEVFVTVCLKFYQCDFKISIEID